jgi:hypothetical protein
MKDSSIAASLRESVAFNDIARWTKIIVKWGSVRYHHQSQATRYEELKIKLYLSCHLLAIFDPCLISHQHKAKKHEDLKISVIYLSNLPEILFLPYPVFLEQPVFLSLYLYFWMPKKYE